MQENLVVNELRFKTEMDCDAVPGRFAAADLQNHHAVGRANRVQGHGLVGQQVRRADLVFGGPVVKRDPDGDRCRTDDRQRVGFGGRRNRAGRLLNFGFLDFVGRRPVGRQRLVRRAIRYGCAARQEKPSDKNDASRFEHAAIVRKAQSDSSCFLIYDLRLTIDERTGADRVIVNRIS